MFRELSHKMGLYLYCGHIKKYFNQNGVQETREKSFLDFLPASRPPNLSLKLNHIPN